MLAKYRRREPLVNWITGAWNNNNIEVKRGRTVDLGKTHENSYETKVVVADEKDGTLILSTKFTRLWSNTDSTIENAADVKKRIIKSKKAIGALKFL